MKINIEALKDSNEFLNILLENITTAIFILNKDNRIRSFNDSFKAVFQKVEFDLVHKLRGNGLGCEFAVEAKAECGTTKYCENCKLRKSFLNLISENVPTYKKKLVKYFYINGKKTKKHLIYSTKYLTYQKEKMVADANLIRPYQTLQKNAEFNDSDHCRQGRKNIYDHWKSGRKNHHQYGIECHHQCDRLQNEY